MRILCVGSMYPPHHLGGYELVWEAAVAELRRRGHVVRVLCSGHREIGAVGPDRPEDDVHRDLRWYWRDHAFPRLGPRRIVALERANAATFDRHAEVFAPEVVAWWAMGGMSLSLVERARRRGLPAVAFVNDDWLIYGPQVDAWMRLAARIPPRLLEAATGLPARFEPAAFQRLVFASDAVRRAAQERWALPLAEVAHGGIDPRFLEPPSVATRAASVPARAASVPARAASVPARAASVPARAASVPARAASVPARAASVPARAASGPAPAASATASAGWAWRLLYVGRIDPRKGIATLLDALACLPTQASLTIVGPGEDAHLRELRDQAARLGLTARVDFPGRRERAELASIYADADAVVFPVLWAEPWGLVPLEAMACGRPVVATGTGGSAEYLRDGENCLLFPPGDAAQLAERLGRLAAEAPLRARLRAGGLRTAAANTDAAFHDRVEAAIAQAADRA